MRAVSRVVRVRSSLGVCVHFLLAAVQAEIILSTLKRRRGGQSCGTQGCLFGTNSPVSHTNLAQYSGIMLSKSFFQLIYSKMYGRSSDNCVPYSGVFGGTYYQSQAVL